VVADPFKTILFVKRGLVIAISFCVRSIRPNTGSCPAIAGSGGTVTAFGTSFGAIGRSGKAAGASDACEGGNSEEPSSRRIYGRVCGWRDIHPISLGHLELWSLLARVRAGAEVCMLPLSLLL
jgi:hypothetical protein